MNTPDGLGRFSVFRDAVRVRLGRAVLYGQHETLMSGKITEYPSAD